MITGSYKVGDRVNIPDLSVTGTIQYMEPSTSRYANILLGWKEGETRYNGAWDIASGIADGKMLEGYTYGYWVPFHYLKGVVGSSSTSASSGMKCTRCGEFNSYAVPNQPDSTYKCYACRQPH